jgi:hypothetical protein
MINLLMPVIVMMLIGGGAVLNDVFVGCAFTNSRCPECREPGTSVSISLPTWQKPQKLPPVVAGNADAIVLTEGIVGGFIPAHVRLNIIFVPGADGVDVWIRAQPDRKAKSRYLKGKMPIKEFKKLTALIQKKKIWGLPIESPRGSQDIYQLDTSLNFKLGKRSWSNGGPQGCVHGQSKTQASDEQRKRFSQIVDQLKKSANQHAMTEIEAKNFESAVQGVASRRNEK